MFGRLFGGKNKGEATDNDTLKSLRETVDGYIGYKNVNNRKETDEAIRKYWYELTLDLISEYSNVQNQLMEGQMLSTWSASNSIINMLNDLKSLLKSDVYRHTTFFETQDVSDSLELSVLYVLESETILEMRDIKAEIQDLKQKLEDLELGEIEKDVLRIKQKVEEVKTTISDRAELIASFELVGT